MMVWWACLLGMVSLAFVPQVRKTSAIMRVGALCDAYVGVLFSLSSEITACELVHCTAILLRIYRIAFLHAIALA